jgi:hypothetical protein
MKNRCFPSGPLLLLAALPLAMAMSGERVGVRESECFVCVHLPQRRGPIVVRPLCHAASSCA